MGKIEDLADYLLLNGTLQTGSGLWHGKTGVAVFFLYYAKHTGNDLFEEYASDLITAVQSDLYAGMPSDYESGIAGTGAGIEYLIRQGFLEPENNRIFADFDRRIYHAVMHEMPADLTLTDGFSGWGRYLVYRLQGKTRTGAGRLNRALVHILREIERKMKKETITDTEQIDAYCFLQDVSALPEHAGKAAGLLEKCREQESVRHPDSQKLFPHLGDTSVGNMARLHLCRKYFGINTDDEMTGILDTAERQTDAEQPQNAVLETGLLRGLAGEGMLYLTALHRHETLWLNLF
jgi:hypothetical protein